MENITIERIVIIAKLSDGTVKQILIPDKDQTTWIGAIESFYDNIKVIDKNIDTIDF